MNQKTSHSFCILLLVLLFSLSSCAEKRDSVQAIENLQNSSTALHVDHLNIWVKNPKRAKELLTNLGFTAVPDSLSEVHHGQGTSGRYFNFLNTYIELIFVHDQQEFDANNRKNEDLDFAERAGCESNQASPFGIALKVEEYQWSKIPFETVSYHQDWMSKGANIYQATNSKKHLKQPSVFVVYPELEWRQFESMTALQNTPSDDDRWKELFQHPNKAERLTNIVITSTSLDSITKSIAAVNSIDNIFVKPGKSHLLELYFDNNIRGKSFDLRPEIPLIIYL